MATGLLSSCGIPRALPDTVYGQLYFPAATGARVDVMSASCLVSGDPCPSPVTLSLYPEEWNVSDLSWKPDGSTAAVMSTDQPKNHLALYSPPSRQLRRFASLASISEFAWSPDGNLLAVAGVTEHGTEPASSTLGKIEGSNIFLYSAAGKELSNLTADMPGMKSDISWLGPDKLLFQSYRSQEDCNVYQLTVSGDKIMPWSATPLCDASPAASPDGTRVAYVLDGNLYLADGAGANATVILDLPAPIAHPTWSLDGQWIGFDEIAPLAASVVKPDGTSYTKVAENVHIAYFAPLMDEVLLLTTAVHAPDSPNTTASWFVTPVPNGPPRAIIVPGISPAEMPLGLSWRPPDE